MEPPTTPPGPSPGAPVGLDIDGPLSREQAIALLEDAASRSATDPLTAGRIYQRVVGHRDPDITAAALLGFGEALARLGRDSEAVDAWQSVTRGPETPATYPAWRNLAAARVRLGDLAGARTAYEQAEHRAPPEDKAEIAGRLGWVNKELGDAGASRRWFARARGGGVAAPVTIGIIAVTIALSLAAMTPQGEDALLPALWLDKAGVADGEYWRLWTVTLVHGGLIHLAFNMYALWLAGPIVERFYGPAAYLVIYLLCAAAGSVASFVFGGDIPSVGASGAIFGLFGVLIAASRAHDPSVDLRTRAILGQLAPLVLINLAFGFFTSTIDNAAHVGGLLAGLWLGALMVPGGVTTLIPASTGPEGAPSAGWRTSVPLRAAGVLALVVVLVVGIAIGTRARGGTGPDGILAEVSMPRTMRGAGQSPT